MLLAQLHDHLVPSFPLYARKDLQTAVRILARALDCSDPQHCSLEQYNQPLPQLYRLVEDYLIAQGKGPHTQGFQHVWRRCHPQSLCGRTTILPPSTGYENDGHGSTFWQLVQQ